MKNAALIFAILFGVSSGLSATATPGGEDVPENVKKAFMKLHPNATDVEWEMEDSYYEAEYEMNGYEMESLFNADGEEVECVVEMEGADIPLVVFNSLLEDYAGWEVEDAEMEEKDGKIMYEIEVENDEGVEWELWYSKDGTLVKKELEDDD